MRFEEVHRRVGGVPYISVRNAKTLYDMILENQVSDILELGIAHGTATCYMAAALQEMGRGQIEAIDLEEARDKFKPDADEQLRKCGLSSYVSISRMKTGYNWFLHDEIERQTKDGVCQPKYDLCIIDGPKNWTIDGCAFFLVDKLLKASSWLIFDDYLWTYAAVDTAVAATDGVTHRTLSEDELRTPQIREVFELLVKQHPQYSDFKVNADGNWAMARKIAGDTKHYTFVYDETVKDFWGYACRRLGNRLFPKC